MMPHPTDDTQHGTPLLPPEGKTATPCCCSRRGSQQYPVLRERQAELAPGWGVSGVGFKVLYESRLRCLGWGTVEAGSRHPACCLPCCHHGSEANEHCHVKTAGRDPQLRPFTTQPPLHTYTHTRTHTWAGEQAEHPPLTTEPSSPDRTVWDARLFWGGLK